MFAAVIYPISLLFVYNFDNLVLFFFKVTQPKHCMPFPLMRLELQVTVMSCARICALVVDALVTYEDIDIFFQTRYTPNTLH